MRHTHATLGLAAGAPLDWISNQLGHGSIQITKHFYARYIKATHDRNVAILDGFEAEQESSRVKNVSHEQQGP